jgi:hypothetical protein
MDWREYASKMVVLIADAPPHGIGEYGDGQYLPFLIYIYIFHGYFVQDSMKVLPMVMIHYSWHEQWRAAESLWQVFSLPRNV